MELTESEIEAFRSRQNRIAELDKKAQKLRGEATNLYSQFNGKDGNDPIVAKSIAEYDRVSTKLNDIQSRRSELEGLDRDLINSFVDAGDPDGISGPPGPGMYGDSRRSKWVEDGVRDWSLNLDMRALLSHNPPSGSPVRGAAGNRTIWQQKLEQPGAWLSMIPTMGLLSEDGSAGGQFTLEVSGLKHDPVDDGDSPVESGSAASTEHSAQFRASLIRIGWPQNLDIPMLSGVLTGMVTELYRKTILEQVISSLAGGSVEISTGKATALPSAADSVGKLQSLCTSLDVQYRDGSVLIARPEWLDLIYSWSQSAAAQRGIVDFIQNPEMNFLGRSTQYSKLLDDGTSANDESAYVFDPSCLRLIQSGMLSARFSWSRDSWYLFCGSRFVVSLLDKSGCAKMITKA